MVVVRVVVVGPVAGIPEPRVALSEVGVAGDGVPASCPELPYSRRHTVVALARALVANALRHRLDIPGAADPVPGGSAVASASGQGGKSCVADTNLVGSVPAARSGAALLVEDARVGLPDEGIVTVAEEATGELDGGAGSKGAERRDTGDSGSNAIGAIGGLKVAAALEEAEGREGGRGGGGCEVGEGSGGGGGGEGGEERVYVDLEWGSRGVAGLGATGVDVGSGGVVGRRQRYDEGG